jgi:energy-coupling factor transport system ATP-binding protein
VAESAVAASSVAASAPALEIDELTVRYFGREVDAISELSLDVAPGAMVGVTGRNGAGKSTLLLAAAGLVPRIVRARVGGSVKVAGESISDPNAARRIGIVFPNPANQLSATKATVREELAFGLENLGVPREEMDARIEAVLGQLSIRHLADRMPFALSGGEQQRVAIASTIAMGTDVIALDEPTGQLDPAGTRSVAELLVDLANEGAAVLVAEHDAAVLGQTRRLLVLEAGRAIAQEAPGAALGSAVLGPLGLRPPTLVLLAEAAGVAPSRAFDEQAIVAALHAAPPRALGPGLVRDPAVAWEPMRAVAPAPVDLSRIVHRYPSGQEAVRGVNLSIEPGEGVVIVGQNGSGKTTLVKHLNGLLRPTAGAVTVSGRDIRDDPVHVVARTVGFVFQNPDDQLFNRSVAREVAFGPRNVGFPEDLAERLVDQAMAVVGLSDAKDDNPYDRNVSDRKLVALASVLAMDPAVLVLDEPTTGQDGPGIARVGAIVDAYRAAGRTVVAISHDMEFAARHFPRVVVMRDGEIVADGPPAEVFAPSNDELLASTGLTPPPAARIAAALGLGIVPADAAALVAALSPSRVGSPD